MICDSVGTGDGEGGKEISVISMPYDGGGADKPPILALAAIGVVSVI